jgi:uncharacterized protein (DUF1499 family)
MRMGQILIILGLIAAVCMLLFIRISPMPASTWHVDPATVTRPTTPNYFLMRDGDGDVAALRVSGTVADVADRLNAIAGASPRTRLVGGSIQAGHVTYMQRSLLMGFPDALSLRLTQSEEDEVIVQAFARARFGSSDFGVNRTWVTSWLSQLAP